MSTPGSGEWLTLREAAERLGLTKEALRKRINAGQLDAYQDEKGRWMVRLSKDQPTTPEVVDPATTALPTPITHDNAELVQRLVALGEAMQQQLANQQRELERLSALIEAQEKRQPARDEWVVERMREMLAEKPRRPWWKFWQD
jgi:excisionase family DNA binding protein